SFDAHFVALMTAHHDGAIAMADEAVFEASEPRLKLMAHGIRHAQRGEIELLHGREGIPAVRAAIRALLPDRRRSRAASVPADRLHPYQREVRSAPRVTSMLPWR
ncbi:MAG TPA: DUF305 domain-containing protein, partial [Microvirga sp.]|nr:DUF305 domain-containing protein [Microvirga sp.]